MTGKVTSATTWPAGSEAETGTGFPIASTSRKPRSTGRLIGTATPPPRLPAAAAFGGTGAASNWTETCTTLGRAAWRAAMRSAPRVTLPNEPPFSRKAAVPPLAPNVPAITPEVWGGAIGPVVGAPESKGADVGAAAGDGGTIAGLGVVPGP